MINTQHYGLILAVVVALATITAPAAAQEEEPQEQIVVTVNGDGSADLQVHFTYDLDEDQEQEAFEDLRNDAESQAELETVFKERMVSVADSAANTTDREMSISEVSSKFTTSDSDGTGVVVLTATYEGFAAINGNQLIITEPFSSEYSADLPVTINAPEGYTISSLTPDSTESSTNSASWSAGESLEGMEVVMTAESETTEESTPGLGVSSSLIALAGAALLAWREN